MTRSERRNKRMERQNFWNNVLSNIDKMQDEVDELLAYTPSCLEKKPSQQVKEDAQEYLSELVGVSKECFGELVNTIGNMINEITKDYQNNDNIIDAEAKEVEVVEEETSTKEDVAASKDVVDVEAKDVEVKEESTTELAVVNDPEDKVEVVEEKSTKETKSKKETKKEAKSEKVEEEKSTKTEEAKTEEPKKEKPAMECFKPVMKEEPKQEPEGKAKEEKVEEKYEFDPQRGIYDTRVINKLTSARSRFDHSLQWVNHMPWTTDVRDAARNLVVAWAGMLGMPLFDTESCKGGGQEEFEPYRQRIKFLLDNREINPDEAETLTNRCECHPRWDYFGCKEQHMKLEPLIDRYFLKAYPWVKDRDDLLFAAMQKVMGKAMKNGIKGNYPYLSKQHHHNHEAHTEQQQNVQPQASAQPQTNFTQPGGNPYMQMMNQQPMMNQQNYGYNQQMTQPQQQLFTNPYLDMIQQQNAMAQQLVQPQNFANPYMQMMNGQNPF